MRSHPLTRPTHTGDTRLSIDMCGPAHAGAELGVEPAALIDLVNTGRLRAYDVGGAIRFRVADITALASAQVLA